LTLKVHSRSSFS